MSETIHDKIKNYRTAPFDARFPNTNQTRNCYQNYLGEDMDLNISTLPSHNSLNGVLPKLIICKLVRLWKLNGVKCLLLK